MKHADGKTRRLALVGFVGILAALSGSSVPALAATSITTCGFVIVAPGNYVVNADLTCSGDAIDIMASGVSLNLNGHIIAFSSSTHPMHVGINVGISGSTTRLNHVSIQGPGLIQGFVQGIAMTYCDYCQVALVTAARNICGMTATRVTYLTVGSNSMVANLALNNTGDLGSGLVLWGSANGVVANNNLSGNGGYGLEISDGAANTVNNNSAHGNFLDGIFNARGTDFSRIYSNLTEGNGGSGIYVEDRSWGHSISRNTSRGNGIFDLNDQNLACHANTWSDNVFFTVSQPCIH